jgi:hypothetical protein|tara:strand:- start:324 stop:428 length:105 start_codon:yes stop_codon:yes gene_type:complete
MSGFMTLGLLKAVIYKPDFVVSLRETETALHRQG